MSHPAAAPTNVRYLVLSVTALLAIFMYVDRVCISQVSQNIQHDLDLTAAQMDLVKSSVFFWSYALTQVPAGLFGLRFGFRNSLAMYLFLWSFFTAVTGLAGGFAALIGARLAVGVTEAGAYPTAAALVKGWFPLNRRGFANSVVSLGGRLGGAFGQFITPILIVAFGAAVIGGSAVAGWRLILISFGGLGMIWSIVFWIVARDNPARHPWCNQAEAELPGPTPGLAFIPPTRLPLRLFLGSRNLWALSLMQFCTNMGWAFLINNFPDYLQLVHGKLGEEKGSMSSLPLLVGCVGMFVGGFFTDWLTRRFGLLSGRRIPILIGTIGCASAYLFCVTADSAWAVVGAMCAVTIFNDLGVPAVWSITQDIGGKRVGPVLGWANMWGNIGAACNPIVMGLVQREFGWPAVFWTGTIAFLLATACAFLIDPRKPLEPEPDSHTMPLPDNQPNERA